ncbi:MULTISPECIES: EMC3/TMCO1 family protein [Desulfobacula]|uniref:Uncharacterized protein n=2 Tax=Desulfobacula TaxID=28222 RepID=K0NCL8_DESTT|nr:MULTISPECIES: EMC3/TMCO1 family protein [Desulfobacula]CCK78561.1 uncharacterized protein TOL2_C03910 [Desulfobacula toluolica Tol2]SDT89909.1 Integral membrane protein DUF106 [Desulfobacula phenolica]
MDDFLDRVWVPIEAFLSGAVVFFDTILSPLEILGPGFVIFFIAFVVVCITRIIARVYVTKRYVRLKEDFSHWKEVREEAMKHPDREKAKALAKNIDQAQLNKAYYDYFFEGLLKNLISTVLPILLTAAYVTKIYTPQTLLTRFGNEWIFTFWFGASFQVNVSSLFWFVICLLLAFILLAILKKVFKKRNG